MPSAHAAMVSAAAHGVGLYIGYNTAAFAIAFILALIVIYDAIGVRFHSGRHARSINILTGILHYGHPLRSEPLQEVLGHTPREAMTGALLGVSIAQAVWFIWR
jgi:acid phosphatase family membrane protein YuiD